MEGGIALWCVPPRHTGGWVGLIQPALSVGGCAGRKCVLCTPQPSVGIAYVQQSGVDGGLWLVRDLESALLPCCWCCRRVALFAQFCIGTMKDDWLGVLGS